MRVVLVSQYYPPEIAAAANRVSSFARALRAAGHDVTVICEQPNYPDGVYQPGFGRRPIVRRQEDDGVDVVHTLVVTPRGGRARRVANYASFASASGVLTLIQRSDVVVASSPPLTAALAPALAARFARRPFVLDVRDLWPAAIVAVGEIGNRRVLDALSRSERWLYRTSTAITTTTQPFARHIRGIAPAADVTVVANGALDHLVDGDWPPAAPLPPFVVGYTGNLGLAQGLDALPVAADILRDLPVSFRIVGRGPRREELERACRERGLDAVTFEDPVPAGQVGAVLAACHALWVPLGAHPSFHEFVPSKLFDAAAVGRPVIASATGEAARIVGELGIGLVVPPEDGAALAAAIRRLIDDPEGARRFAAAGRSAAPTLARRTQAASFVRAVVAAAAGGRR